MQNFRTSESMYDQDHELLFDQDYDVDNYCNEVELIDEMHSSIHQKRGRSRHARRYIEDYWEQKHMDEIMGDSFD